MGTLLTMWLPTEVQLVRYSTLSPILICHSLWINFLVPSCPTIIHHKAWENHLLSKRYISPWSSFSTKHQSWSPLFYRCWLGFISQWSSHHQCIYILYTWKWISLLGPRLNKRLSLVQAPNKNIEPLQVEPPNYPGYTLYLGNLNFHSLYLLLFTVITEALFFLLLI